MSVCITVRLLAAERQHSSFDIRPTQRDLPCKRNHKKQGRLPSGVASAAETAGKSVVESMPAVSMSGHSISQTGQAAMGDAYYPLIMGDIDCGREAAALQRRPRRNRNYIRYRGPPLVCARGGHGAIMFGREAQSPAKQYRVPERACRS
jgi:hypothetical protein